VWRLLLGRTQLNLLFIHGAEDQISSVGQSLMLFSALKDIGKVPVRYVMKNGEFYDGDTMDQIWPDNKKLPPFWWWPKRNSRLHLYS
jgi:predicted peptidase